MPTGLTEDETPLLATADRSIDREVKAANSTYLHETYRNSEDGQPYA
jgi:hypothetical protein